MGTKHGLTILALSHVVALASLAAWREAATWPLEACLVLSAFSFAQHAWDKAAARRGARRVPEQSLLVVVLLGGWPGAALGQAVFRHKTRKAGFQRAFRWMVAASLALTYGAVWIVYALG